MFVEISANVWLGLLGGFIPSILTVIHWARTERTSRPPAPFSDPAFWVLFFLLPLIGGGVVMLYESFGTHFNGLLAFQVGLTAPAFLQQLASGTPPLGKKD
jgi:hypothetical protein